MLRQDQFMAEIDVSWVSNEELCKAYDELRKDLQQLSEHSIGERDSTIQRRARPRPFSQAIMDVVIPVSFITPKIVFTGAEDPEAHLTTFNAQMMILRGTNTMHCKMFMCTFTGTTLSGLLASRTVTSLLSINFLDCSGNNSLLTKLNRQSLLTVLV